MYVPLWVFGLLLVVYVAFRRYRSWLARLEETTARDVWKRLSRARRAEILHVRERIERGGATYATDFANLTNRELDEAFENSVRNAKSGEQWALKLLYEQIYIHRGFRRESPSSPLSGHSPGHGARATNDGDVVPYDASSRPRDHDA
jgi:hypothetical protein